MSTQLPEDLGLALDESSLIGFEFLGDRRLVAITLEVLTLPPEGPAPADRRRQLVFEPIGRVAASLRDGVWNDRSAKVHELTLDDLEQVVSSFGGLPIYGAADLIDSADKQLTELADRLSLDWENGSDGRGHSISLFQEGPDRHLDLWVWFDTLRIFDPTFTEVSLNEFVDGGRRWWSGLYAGDPRTNGYGIVPLR